MNRVNREALFGAIGELSEELLERSERAGRSGDFIFGEKDGAAETGTNRESKAANRIAGQDITADEDGTAGQDRMADEDGTAGQGRMTDEDGAAGGSRTERREKTAGKKWTRGLLAAACLLLAVLGVRETIDRLGLLRMGCSTWAGTIVDGVYYYYQRHSGVWRYTPEEGSRRVLSEWDMDGWQVNEYGIYYSQGRGLYVKEHETGKSRCLFKSGFFESSHISFSLQKDKTVVVTVYNKSRETKYQILLDAVTGESLGQVTEILPYVMYDGLLYSEAALQVGDRRLTLVSKDRREECDLQENGESILKEDWPYVSSFRKSYFGDNLFLQFREEGDGHGSFRYLVLRPDGNDSVLELGYMPSAGTNEFLFDSRGFGPVDHEEFKEAEEDSEAEGSQYDTIWCMEIAAGEYWQLELDMESSGEKLPNGRVAAYDMATDGELLFTCAPWAKEQTCWRIVYNEEGKPAVLELISADIRKD